MDSVPCTYRISVKAVIKNDEGRILLIKESGYSWELPGGGLEHGEDPRQGLTREIAEETGFNVDWMSEKPVGFWSIYKEVGSPTLKWFAVIAYEAKVSGEFKSDSVEAEESGYFSVAEIKTLKLHDNTAPYFSIQDSKVY